jgi:CBS domain containing-hemolysin-like protein
MSLDPVLTVVGSLVILFLVLASAFFSSSELAIFSLARHRIDALAAEGAAGGQALEALRSDPHRLLVTVLVGNNVANIAAASISTALLVQVLPAGQAVTGATVFTSGFVLVLGEIAPKSYAVSNAEPWALRVARPLVAVQRLMSPVVAVFEVATNAVNRFTGGSSEFERYLTREDIQTIVLSGEASGALDTDEGAMIRGVLDLEATAVRAVMVPRTDMVSVPLSASLEEVVDVCVANHLTRLPVYGENRDDIRGIVDLRDALAARESGDSLDSILVDPQFVPAAQPVDELLAEIQTGGADMAVVVDEFGAVVGIATLEDLIEEVVGEIFDRGDLDPIRVVDDATAIAGGRATVAYVNETLGVDLPTDGEFETLAGLVHATVGRLPEEGDRVEFGSVALTVLEATDTRLRRIRIDHDGGGGDTDAADGTDPSPSAETGERGEPDDL